MDAFQQIQLRLNYRVWLVKLSKEIDELIIQVDYTFFEPRVLKNIMKDYDIPYKIKFVKYYGALL